MNRITQLAVESDLIQWDILPSGVRSPDHESMAKVAKFAELIVQECISILEQAENGYRDYRDQIEDGMRDHCIDLIKHKFEVE